MPTDPATFPDADPDESTSLGWWLSGGASLLVWTGVALLLTTA